MLKLRRFVPRAMPLLLAVIVFAAQVGPSDARSNLVRWTGISLPKWVPPSGIVLGVVVGCLIYYAWLFRGELRGFEESRKRQGWESRRDQRRFESQMGAANA